ncbi:hypothetical protein T07_5732 [Trichinella nelsoni]|uniref:Uncharacterized protein n=1 Tax=Trichinella nelsoni TaxID=6336 RepID=A0A0V0SK30_9BILA|nr:hypothetical protein T07_5732 [Trichinella nelsoni]
MFGVNIELVSLWDLMLHSQMNEIENTSNDSAPDFVIVCAAVICLSMARIADPVAWPELVDISGHGCSALCFEPDTMMENKRQYLSIKHITSIVKGEKHCIPWKLASLYAQCIEYTLWFEHFTSVLILLIQPVSDYVHSAVSVPMAHVVIKIYKRSAPMLTNDELDHSSQQFHNSSDDDVIDEGDTSANARRKYYI